jgi:hypothetical protein
LVPSGQLIALQSAPVAPDMQTQWPSMHKPLPEQSLGHEGIFWYKATLPQFGGE